MEEYERRDGTDALEVPKPTAGRSDRTSETNEGRAMGSETHRDRGVWKEAIVILRAEARWVDRSY
jgi:hypothetical protein